jgi:CHAT domain-containing protein
VRFSQRERIGWTLRVPGLVAFCIAISTANAAEVAASHRPHQSTPRTLVEVACAEFNEPGPPDRDPKTEDEEIDQLQYRGDPEALVRSCKGWRRAVLHPSQDMRMLEWQVRVGGSLMWLRRPAEAIPILEDAYAQYTATSLPPWRAVSLVAGALAVLHFQRAETDAALAWSRRAAESAARPESGMPLKDRLRVQINHGGLLSQARQFAEAEALLQEVLRESEARIDEHAAEAAPALDGLAKLAQRQGRYKEALTYSDRQIALRSSRVPEEPIPLVIAMRNRAMILIQLARFTEAESSLSDAISRAALGGVDLFNTLANTYEALATLQLARGRISNARESAERAVTLYRSGPEGTSAAVGRPLRTLAAAQTASGDLSSGIASYRAGLELLSQSSGGSDPDTLNALRLGYTQAMIDLGDLTEAQVTLGALTRSSTPATPAERATAHALQATLSIRLGQTAQALSSLSDADVVLSASVPADHPQRLILWAQGCEIAIGQCVEPPADVGVNLGREPEAEALVEMARARLHQHRGNRASAEQALHGALAAAVSSGRPRLQWQVYAAFGEFLIGAGKRADGIFFGKLALITLQSQRSNLLPMGAAADALYLADKLPIYRRVSEWLLDSHRLSEALEVMRLLKRQEQDDFRQRAGVSETPPLALSPAEQVALDRFKAVTHPEQVRAKEIDQLRRLVSANRITTAESQRLNQLQSDSELSRIQIRRSLGELLSSLNLRDNGTQRKVERTGPASFAHFADTMHVHLLAGKDRLSALFVGQAGAQLKPVNLSSNELARDIAAVRDAIEGRTDPIPALVRLNDELGRLIDQQARRQRARRLILWLDGPLRYLPVGLLTSDGLHLAQRYELLVVGPDGLQERRVQPIIGVPNLAAFGVTRAMSGLPALPAVADELCNIVRGPVQGLETPNPKCGPRSVGAGPIPGTGRLNEYFTVEALGLAAAPMTSHRILHIGTHFVLRPGNVSKSWLLMGNGSRLPLEELRRIEWGNPALVTLSACETGLLDSASSDGRELDGLAAAVMASGADRVLASLWRVDDTATARFMLRYYRAFASSAGNAGLALHVAQRESIGAGEPPHHWAAFVLLTNRVR